MKPLYKRSGEVVQFPRKERLPQVEKPHSGDPVEKGKLLSFRRWHMLHFGTDVLGFYESKEKANSAAVEVKAEFVDSRLERAHEGIIEDAISTELYMSVGRLLQNSGTISNIEIDGDTPISVDLKHIDESHVEYVGRTADFYEIEEWRPTRSMLADAGLGIVESTGKYEPPDFAIMEYEPPYLLDFNLENLPGDLYAKMLTRDRQIKIIIEQVAETIAKTVVYSLRH